GSLLAYFGRTSVNPVTGQKQHISLSVNQEIALGLQSAPEMAKQFGGLDPDEQRQRAVKAVGQRIVAPIPKPADTYPFNFPPPPPPRAPSTAPPSPAARSSPPAPPSTASPPMVKSRVCSGTRSATSSSATPPSRSPSSNSARASPAPSPSAPTTPTTPAAAAT